MWQDEIHAVVETCLYCGEYFDRLQGKDLNWPGALVLDNHGVVRMCPLVISTSLKRRHPCCLILVNAKHQMDFAIFSLPVFKWWTGETPTTEADYFSL